jgi:hypothetical protein
MGPTKNAYDILVAKSEGMKPLGRPRCRWDDNIRMDPREMGWEYMDWMDVEQWRALVNTVMNLRVP